MANIFITQKLRKELAACIDEVMAKSGSFHDSTATDIPNKYPNSWDNNRDDILEVLKAYGFTIKESGAYSFTIYKA